MNEVGTGRLHYGMIGFGGIGENRIAREGFCLDTRRFRAHPLARLVAATDLNPARRQAVEALGLRWHGSAAELLQDPGVQAVFVSTNNASHAAVAAQALQAGKHCIVEKPIATRLEDARELRRLAAAARLSLAVDHMMVYNGLNREAARLVAGGRLGEVNDVCLHMEFLYGKSPEEARTWRCADPQELGGPLGDVGSHCLYMAEFLLSRPIRRLACVYLPRTLSIGVENGAFVQFELQGGLGGSARVAFNQPRGGLGGTLTNLGYELYGEGAALRAYGTLFQLSGHRDEPVRIRLELERFTSRRTVRLRPSRRPPNLYQELIRAHARSVLAGSPTDGSDGVHNLALVAACHESARAGGTWIEVSD